MTSTDTKPVCITPKPDDYATVVTDAPETLAIYAAPSGEWWVPFKPLPKLDPVPPWVRKRKI